MHSGISFSEWCDTNLKSGQNKIVQKREKFTTFQNDLHIWSGTYVSFRHSLGFETELLIEMKSPVVFSMKSVLREIVQNHYWVKLFKTPGVRWRGEETGCYSAAPVTHKSIEKMLNYVELLPSNLSIDKIMLYWSIVKLEK